MLKLTRAQLGSRLKACGAKIRGTKAERRNRLRALMQAKIAHAEAVRIEEQEAEAAAKDKSNEARGVQGDNSIISEGLSEDEASEDDETDLSFQN